MALRDAPEFSNVLKLIPSQFVIGKGIKQNVLHNCSHKEVFISFDRCDFCNHKFIGLIHNNPQDNPIELAISFCGGCTM